MNRQYFSNVGSYSRSTDTEFRNKLLSKQNERKHNNPAMPNRRRSRLGTYRASLLLNQELPVNDTKGSSPKNIQVQEIPTVMPSTSSHSSSNKNNGVKKRLFTRSPVSRRLNMDTSSIILPSENDFAENLDSDVTGICIMGAGVQSTKKPQSATLACNSLTDQANRKYLSSLENSSVMHLKSAKKISTPSRFLLSSKSPFHRTPKASSLKKKINHSAALPKQIPILNKGLVETPPSPPRPAFLKYHSQVIQTPEMPDSLAAVLAAIRNRHSMINLENGESLASNTDPNFETKTDVNSGLDFGLANDQKDLVEKLPVRKSVCPQLFSELSDDDEKNVNSSSITNFHKTCDTSSASYVIRNLSVNFDPDNSLEVAYARVNGTYDIITTTNNTNSQLNSAVDEGNGRDLIPQDDSTETFVYNESLCNDILNSTDNGDGSTIKKKKLSMVTEEPHHGNLPSTSSNNFSNSCITEMSHLFNTNMQITTCETNIGVNNNSINPASIHKILFKLVNTLNNLEESKRDKELFFKRSDDAFKDIQERLLRFNSEKEQFIREQQTKDVHTLTCLYNLKNEIKDLIDCNEESALNSTRISDMLKDTEKIINSAIAPVGVLKTPDHIRRTQSKSVYNQLKTEYSCLKTPKPSTVKKTTVISRKILTPHSMSLCVQDQVDQLFDDDD